MDTYLFHTLILLSGFFAAYVGMYVSWGISAIAIGLLMTLGLPPHIANSTYQLGNIGSNLWGIRHFIRSGNYEKRYIIPMCIIMFVAGVIWSSFLLDISASITYKITGVTFLFLAFMTFLDRKQWVEKFIPTKIQESFGYILLFLTSVWSAIFPAGHGVFFYQIYTRFFGMTALVAKWHQKIVLFGFLLWVLWNVFFQNIYIISYAICFFIGMYFGWLYGSKHVIRLGNTFLRKTILIGMIILGLYFLFGK
jgi:uncharacterized membrane protein YfcA